MYGKSYVWQTSKGTAELGVLEGLGNDWFVGYRKPNGSRKRVSLKGVVVSGNPEEVQKQLDQVAEKRKLKIFGENNG